MAEKRAVTWYEALNEQVEWKDRAMMLAWLTDVFGHAVEPGPEALKRFSVSLRRMRLQLGDAHFEKNFDFAWLNEELNQCRLQFEHHSDSKPHDRLPALRAGLGTAADMSARSGRGVDSVECSRHPDADSLLEMLRRTLLLQFAQFISSIADGGADDAPRIDRCRGLYRDDSSVAEEAAFPLNIEKRWRDEIELLVQHDSVASDVGRCEYFFPRTPKGRFCSDSCRFSTFQITKQLEEPNYLADKQKRYRSSKKS
ncbi:MAG: hypothetical protein U0103_26540 [Candidatus Obscuribacterales bacterium]